MKTTKKMLVALAVAAGTLAAAPAFAHHHWHGSRVVLGFNFGFPAYYPAGYPCYYPAPVTDPPVVVQQAPATYVQQPAAAPAPAASASSYWHYCAGSRSYYPYVTECPGGWQRVSPTPQN